MPIEDRNDELPDATDKPSPPHKRHHHRRRFVVPVIAAAVALAIGAAGGAAAMKLVRPTPEMAPMTPVAISAMPAASLVTIRGKVAEIYGNKFVLQDDTGKTLIETGPAGDDGDLVVRDETVTVQGRFDDGFVHGSYLVREDGRTEALRPPKGPPPHRLLPDLARKLAP